jgi:hypothetical protein
MTVALGGALVTPADGRPLFGRSSNALHRTTKVSTASVSATVVIAAEAEPPLVRPPLFVVPAHFFTQHKHFEIIRESERARAYKAVYMRLTIKREAFEATIAHSRVLLLKN